MLKEQQPPLSVDEQIENLKAIGLTISDEEKAKALLNHVSYFRLIKAFSLGLKPKNGNYDSDITFDTIVDLYKFNCHFRHLLMSLIKA